MPVLSRVAYFSKFSEETVKWYQKCNFLLIDRSCFKPEKFRSYRGWGGGKGQGGMVLSVLS